MQRRLGRAVRNDDPGDGVSWVVATDIVEDRGGLYLCLDLPDVDEGSLEVEQNSLSVKATRRYRKGENQTVHYQGRPKGTFARVFNVPTSFDLGKVTASYDGSVLTLLVPRSESTRPRKVDVATGRTHQGTVEVQAQTEETPQVEHA